ncbi:hypothetical protein [Clostridium baratii]|uniref:hypothetical protein n=1 Tax=Clostridium baratii TaxID=1561 RepID=UPI003D7BAEF2
MKAINRKTFFVLRLVSFITSMFPFTFYMFFTYKDDTYRFKSFFGITPRITVWLMIVIQVLSIIYILIFYFRRINSCNENIVFAKFSEVKLERSNTSNYILANVLPIATIDLDTELKAWFLALILVFLGIMYIKNNLMNINPLYDLIGVKVYEGTAKFNIGNIDKGSGDIIVISKVKVNSNTESNSNIYELVEGYDNIFFCIKNRSTN